MKPCVSVIVPIYNTAEYLPECLDSLLGQTYRNLEIILIDDGSPDKAGAIADAYAERDSRIKVIHKENGGVSRARNVGIDQATGEYIAFVDSDDAVTADYFELLLHHARSQDADICFCISHIMGTPPDPERSPEYHVFSGEEGLKHLLLADLFGCAPNKMFRSRILDNYRFQEDIAINEDLLMNYTLFGKAERICFVDRHKYLYRHREGSASRSGFNRKQLDTIRVNRAILDSLTDPELRSIAMGRCCGVLSACHRGTVCTPGFEPERREIQAEIRHLTAHWLSNRHLGLKKKCELLLQGYCGPLCKFLYTRNRNQ